MATYLDPSLLDIPTTKWAFQDFSGTINAGAADKSIYTVPSDSIAFVVYSKAEHLNAALTIYGTLPNGSTSGGSLSDGNIPIGTNGAAIPYSFDPTETRALPENTEIFVVSNATFDGAYKIMLIVISTN